jgi:hypothetical protein
MLLGTYVVAAHSKNRTKHKLYWQNAEYFNVTACGTYNNQYALKGLEQGFSTRGEF